MSSPAWNRASFLPAVSNGRVRPEIAALDEEMPSVADLFTFMRDAELRFDTLRMRIEEHTATTRGEEILIHELALRHPGEAKVVTSPPDAGPGAGYEIWQSDGSTVRTYVSARKLGTQRPARAAVRGVAGDADLPGRSRFYTPVTPLQMETLPELFIHPAGYCQNVLATGRCWVAGAGLVAGREAIVVVSEHPRSVELVADRPDFVVRIWVDRADGVILRLEETMAGAVNRDAIVTSYQPNAALPPSALTFAFPAGTTLLY